MNSIQNYSGNELSEQLRAPKTVDITVNGEELRLIERFRRFNILGKANVIEVINAFGCLDKFTDMGINLYEKRSVQQ